MREIDIQNEIRKALSARGVVLRLNNGMYLTQDGRVTRSGLPNGTSDLLFIGKGYVAFIEVKQPGGVIRREQRKFLDAMRELGHRAGVAYSARDALDIIQGESFNEDNH